MLTLLYILVFYTDLTDQEFTFRNDLGLVSIFLTLFNFAVHIILLSVDSLIQAKQFLRRKCCMKQAKNVQKSTQNKDERYAVQVALDKEVLS